MPRPRPRPAVIAASALMALTVAACGPGTGATAAGPSASAGEITVFAAASLTDSFEQIGKAFEAAHPGTTVRFNFGASSALATQITQGAPADVFAASSPKTMDSVVTAKVATTPVTFVTNWLQIAVPPGNPAGVAGVSDLAEPAVKVALCQVQVPCGEAAAKVFANAKITVQPVTEEADVRATLAKVELGEVDAAVVWVTDVLAAGDKVQGIEIPAEVNVSSAYPIATLTQSRNVDLAQAFVDYVLSEDGSAVLHNAGFDGP